MRTSSVVVFLLAFTSSFACAEKSGEQAGDPKGAVVHPADVKPDPTTATGDGKPADGKPADGEPADGEPAADVKPADATPAAAEAMTLFKTRCATCHGEQGRGDGPAAAGLNPKPRDYRDPAWQKSVTDEALRTVIVEGGMAVGKSALMPPNPDLKNKPEVVAELVKIIRGLGGQ